MLHRAAMPVVELQHMRAEAVGEGRSRNARAHVRAQHRRVAGTCHCKSGLNLMELGRTAHYAAQVIQQTAPHLMVVSGGNLAFCDIVDRIEQALGNVNPHAYSSPASRTEAWRGSKQQQGRRHTTRTPLARAGPTFMKVASTLVSPPRPRAPVPQALTRSVM